MGRIAGCGEIEFDHLVDNSARRDLDEHAIARHRRVEGDHGVVGALIREQRVDERVAGASQRVAQGRELEASGRRARGQGADAVANDDAQAAGGRGCGRALRDRIGLAHEVAQVRIVPGLDAAMGKAALMEHIESARALAAQGVAAGHGRAVLLEALRKGRFGLGADGGGARGHDRLTPHPRHSRGSRSSPIRAPVPCRRISRCGQRTAHARCRARYIPAGADSE